MKLYYAQTSLLGEQVAKENTSFSIPWRSIIIHSGITAYFKTLQVIRSAVHRLSTVAEPSHSTGDLDCLLLQLTFSMSRLLPILLALLVICYTDPVSCQGTDFVPQYTDVNVPVVAVMFCNTTWC